MRRDAAEAGVTDSRLAVDTEGVAGFAASEGDEADAVGGGVGLAFSRNILLTLKDVNFFGGAAPPRPAAVAEANVGDGVDAGAGADTAGAETASLDTTGVVLTVSCVG